MYAHVIPQVDASKSYARPLLFVIALATYRQGDRGERKRTWNKYSEEVSLGTELGNIQQSCKFFTMRQRTVEILKIG